MADDDMIMIRGAAQGAGASMLLRGANDYMLDEMDRSLHDAFCVVKRVLESGKVVPGECSGLILFASCLFSPCTDCQCPFSSACTPGERPAFHLGDLLGAPKRGQEVGM